MHVMVLNILISTIDQGIDKVADIPLEPRIDVKYIVTHQYRSHGFLRIPDRLIRPDVLISHIPGQGLTKSRNHAIRLATGDICVIADDDVRYNNAYFDLILQIYSTKEIDVACFKIKTLNSQPEYKQYPANEVLLTNITQFSPSSIEITFKREAIINSNIQFDERFGLGTWLNGGGENLFILDAINKGLRVKFFPFYIVEHPFESTIKLFSKYDQRRVRITGALDARINGYLSIFKTLCATIKYFPDLIRHKKNPIFYFNERLSGSIYILKSKLKKQCY